MKKNNMLYTVSYFNPLGNCGRHKGVNKFFFFSMQKCKKKCENEIYKICEYYKPVVETSETDVVEDKQSSDDDEEDEDDLFV